MFLSLHPATFLETFVSGPPLVFQRPKNPFHDMRQPPTTEADMRKEYVSDTILETYYLVMTHKHA